MEKAFLVVLVLGLFSGIYTLWVGLVQFVWNSVGHDVFGLPWLTFWQTFGVLFLLGVVGSAFRAVRGAKS